MILRRLFWILVFLIIGKVWWGLAAPLSYIINAYAGGGSNSGNGGAATSASIGSVRELWVDSTGALFMGTYGSTSIRYVSSNQIIGTLAGSGASRLDGVAATSSSLKDPQGVCGVTTGVMYIADSTDCTIRKVSGGIITTIAGMSLEGTSLGDGGQATSASMRNPYSVKADSNGNIYVSEEYGARVRKITQPGGIISLFAGGGSVSLTNGMQATSALLGNVNGLFVDSVASVYFVEGNTIRKVSVTSGILGTAVGSGSSSPAAGDGVSTSSVLGGQVGVWLDTIGNIFIGEYINYRVRLASISDHLVYTIAGTSTASGLTGDGGPATSALLDFNVGIFGLSTGNIYISCDMRVRKLQYLPPTASPTNSPTIPPSPLSYIINAYAGMYTSDGSFGDGGAASAASMGELKELWFDTIGSLYITDYEDTFIRMVNSNQIISTVAGSSESEDSTNVAATSATLAGPTGVAGLTSGVVYIADIVASTISMISNGIITRIAGSPGVIGITGDGGPASSARFQLPYAVRVDQSNRLYISDNGNAKVRKVSGGTITVYAGGGSLTTVGVQATSASISYIVGMFIDSQNNLYMCEVNRILRVVASSGLISTVAGNGNGSPRAEDGVATSAVIGNPNSVWADSVGNVFVTETGYARLRYVSVSNSLMFTLAGQTGNDYSGDGGPGTDAYMTDVCGLYGSSTGRLFVTNFDVVRSLEPNVPTLVPTAKPFLSPTPSFVPTLSRAPTGAPSQPSISPLSYAINAYAGLSSGGVLGDGGAASSAALSSTRELWADSTGALYVADYYGGRIRLVSANHIISTFAGSGASTADGVAATSSAIRGPQGVCGLTSGVMYILEYDSCTLRMVSGGLVSTIAGSAGVCTVAGDGGAATSGSFNGPFSVKADSAGNLFVSEYGGQRVRKMTPSGGITTYVGGGISTAEGTALTAVGLGAITGVFVDSVATLYFCDLGYSRIKKVTTAENSVMTIIGSGDVSPAASEGVSTSSALSSPIGVWADSLGDVFVTEYNYNRVRLRSVSNTAMYTVAGQSSGYGTSGDGGPATAALLTGVRGIFGVSTGSLYIGCETTVRQLLSLAPTVMPTVAPSRPPTQNPTVSFAPTFPTVSPLSYSIDAYAGVSTGGATAGDGGKATAAVMACTREVWVDSSGALYVADCTNGRVRKVDTNNIITTIAGSGSTVVNGVAATSTKLLSPHGVGGLTSGVIYLADPDDGTVRMILNGIISIYAGISGSIGDDGDGGAATSAKFTTVAVVKFDSNGDLFVTDFAACRLRKISAGGIVTAFAGGGTISMDNSIASTSALLGALTGLFVDSLTAVYFADYTNNKLRKVDRTTGILYSVAGNGDTSPLGDNGVSTSSVVYNPCAVWLDDSRNVFLSDNYSRVRIISSSNSRMYTVAGGLTTGYSGDGGTATAATMDGVRFIYGNSAGSIYVGCAVTVRVLQSTTPTAPPSTNPTLKPSVVPTLSPTGTPTIQSSAAPTVLPSLSPTCCPTQSPSLVPSFEPSLVPTCPPSTIPTLTPTTIVPTFCPTQTPSVAPTNSPSISPTMAPSAPPSGFPSFTPTMGPTSAPSPVPTTTLPTADPTLSPTLAPNFISWGPTLGPTANPTVIPTLNPTVAPSVGPTFSPTLTATNAPTAIPSPTPTSDPSTSPTHVPTASPSINPSTGPTAIPSQQPSVDPTALPSAFPTVVPTTRQPTFAPSPAPTVAPTAIPTGEPTFHPSTVPTIPPSQSPSVEPTPAPTGPPTRQPSAAPTESPSVMPTAGPTTSPTMAPSWCPTLLQTASPSIVPTALPTLTPTILPTEIPTIPPTLLPTVMPTTLPTAQPTLTPTFSLRPTAAPSTLEYYHSHPKATLPSNRSISVRGAASPHFKIVIPFLTVSSRAEDMSVFADVSLDFNSTDSSIVLLGSDALPSALSVTSGWQYSGGIGFDTAKRSAAVLGDVNIDNNDDLIIGDPYASRCYVMFGTTEGLTNMTSGFTIFGEQEGDLTGWSVSGAGDVNNDTIRDIIVGAPFAHDGVGAFYVVYGRSANNFDAYLSNLTYTQGFAVYGAQRSDYLGISVSNAGDVNKDGCDDVIAGAVMTSQFTSGAAYIVYGGRSLSSLASAALLSSDKGYRLTDAAYMYSGYSVSAAGDVNSDGFADVLIGSNPLKAGLPPIAYLVYGTSTLPGNSLLSSVGVKISGGGVVVSSAGDVNRDSHSDLLIGSSLSATRPDVGFIVITNVNFMTRLTSAPSFVPTGIPIVAPTLNPSTVPTRTLISPTVGPTRRPLLSPSVLPTMLSVAPTTEDATQVPTVTATQPPTVAPSLEPSERPTLAPTLRPTEAPTLQPTPAPSQSPTAAPTKIPTTAPITTAPSLPLVTRTPVSFPTLGPSFAATATPTLTVNTTLYLVVSTEPVVNQSRSHMNYLVNTTGEVAIANAWGSNRYTIVPQRDHSKLSIVHFNQSSDVIDLTHFTFITAYSELTITEGSVVVILSLRQSIHILNLHPTDVSAANFVFYPPQTSQVSHSTLVLSAVAAAFIALGGLLFLCCGAQRAYFAHKTAKAAKDRASVLASRHIVTVKTNADGTEIEEQDEDEEEDEEDVSDDESALLSEHTLDSEGNFLYRDIEPGDGTGLSDEGEVTDYANDQWSHERFHERADHEPPLHDNSLGNYYEYSHWKDESCLVYSEHY